MMHMTKAKQLSALVASGSMLIWLAGAGTLQNQGDPAAPGVSSTPSDNWERLSGRFGGSKSSTRADRDVVMSFTQPVEVRDISVEGGQAVTKGSILVEARDADVLAAIELQRDRANNDVEVRQAENARDLAEFRFKSLMASDVGSETEEREREFEFLASQLQLEQAQKNKREEQLRLEQLLGNHERYRLVAPFDGVIEDVMVELGQTVREDDPAVRLVNTDRLKLDPYANTNETIELGLKPGHPAWVLIDLPGEPVVVVGEVKYVSPIAHAASRWRRVRVELENPAGWPAGTPARVRFVEPPSSFNRYMYKPDQQASMTSSGE